MDTRAHAARMSGAGEAAPAGPPDSAPVGSPDEGVPVGLGGAPEVADEATPLRLDRGRGGAPVAAERAPAAADPGLYGPGSEAWRLNRESMLLLGAGPRALLLQIAHPAVAAGVADHSDFRADPWRRLAGTLRSYLTIVYGSTRAARAEIRRLNALHRGITGPGYAARDPELSLWVHATLIDSTIAVADAWLAPVSAARRAAFYAETRPIGRAFGVPDALLPADYESFQGYVGEMLAPAGPVRVSATARELAEIVLRPPLAPLATWLRLVPASVYAWTLWPSVGLLPASVREDYGLAWGARERLVSAWLVAAWRAWRPVLPTSFRQMPKALAADARMSRASSVATRTPGER